MNVKSFFRNKVRFIVIGIVTLVTIMFLVAQHQKSFSIAQGRKAEQFTPLQARVVWTNTLFRIINVGDQTWLNCQFVLNRNQNSMGYIFIRDRVQSREVLQVAHKVFLDPNGQPYILSNNPPTSFSIRCEDVGGKIGVFSGKYDL